MEKLSPNELAFIALANEYCHALERAGECELRDQFVAQMLKLLPRLYITVSDVDDDTYNEEFIDAALEEDVYDLVRERVAQIMAEEDIYLEVFLEDMKYSDTPISASISENLADLYQEFFNLNSGCADRNPARDVVPVQNQLHQLLGPDLMQCVEGTERCLLRNLTTKSLLYNYE